MQHYSALTLTSWHCVDICFMVAVVQLLRLYVARYNVYNK